MSLTDLEKKVLEENTSKTADEFEVWIDDVYLSETQLLVLWLKQYGELENSEVAEALDMEPSNVNTHLSRISEKLDKCNQTVQEVDYRVL